jgi:hypothetical protein
VLNEIMKIKKFHILLMVLGLCICVYPFRAMVRKPVVAIIQIVMEKKNGHRTNNGIWRCCANKVDARFQQYRCFLSS